MKIQRILIVWGISINNNKYFYLIENMYFLKISTIHEYIFLHEDFLNSITHEYYTFT